MPTYCMAKCKIQGFTLKKPVLLLASHVNGQVNRVMKTFKMLVLFNYNYKLLFFFFNRGFGKEDSFSAKCTSSINDSSSLYER